MSPFWRSRRSRRAAFGAATAAVAAACATTPYRGITEVADSPSITSTTVPSEVLGTTTVRPAPSTTAAPVTTTAPATTTAPPTTAAPTTVPPVAPTRPPTTTAAARPGTHAEPIGSGARIEVPDSWTVAAPLPAAGDLAALLPGLAPQLAAAGRVRERAARRLGPRRRERTCAERGRDRDPARSRGHGGQHPRRAARCDRPAGRLERSGPQGSALGDGAYVTYQVTTTGPAPVTVVSEHYAFVRGDTVLLVMMTTNAERAATDGRVFGRMLASLAPTA